MQQREAFLLHHGLEMELRELATAMDCSSGAAANHLVAAATSLRASGLEMGESLSDYTAGLPARIAALVPPRQQIKLEIDQQLQSIRRRRMIRRAISWLVMLTITAAIIWGILKIWPMLVI